MIEDNNNNSSSTRPDLNTMNIVSSAIADDDPDLPLLTTENGTNSGTWFAFKQFYVMKGNGENDCP